MNAQFEKLVSKKTHLIFDFDGTLVSLDIPWETTLHVEIKKALAKYSHITDINKAVEQVGHPLLQELRNLESEGEQKYLQGYVLNTPLVDWIRSNGHRYTFSVWSSNAQQTIQKILSELHLLSMFSFIITRDEVTYLKPHPDGFHLIYQNEPLSAFLMLGDMKADQEAAAAAGIDFFKVPSFS